MMKVAGFVVCGLLSLLQLQAQEVSVGQPVKKMASSTSTQIVCDDAEGFLTIQTSDKSQKSILTRYPANGFIPLWVVGIPYGTVGVDYRYEGVACVKERVLIFTSTFHQESEQLRVYCTIVNKDGHTEEEPALVHYILSESKEEYAGRFRIVLSQDHEKFAICFDPPQERKLNEAISIRVYDDDLDMLWEKELLLPYTKETIQIHHLAMDNQACLWLMSGKKESASFSTPAKTQPGRYALFYYNAGQNRLKEYDITLKDRQIASLDFCLDAAGNLVVAGYYSVNYKMDIVGSFLYHVSSGGGGVLAASFMPFRSLYESYFPDGTSESLPDYYLKELMPLQDGAILLVGERMFTTEHTVHDQFTQTNQAELRYHFGDILVSKLDNSGRHLWNMIIPKDQYSTRKDTWDGYSFLARTTDEGIDVFFNDHRDNSIKSNSSIVSWSGSINNSVVAKAHLNHEEEYSRSNLSLDGERGYLLSSRMNTSHRGSITLGLDAPNSNLFVRIQ